MSFGFFHGTLGDRLLRFGFLVLVMTSSFADWTDSGTTGGALNPPSKLWQKTFSLIIIITLEKVELKRINVVHRHGHPQ